MPLLFGLPRSLGELNKCRSIGREHRKNRQAWPKLLPGEICLWQIGYLSLAHYRSRPDPEAFLAFFRKLDNQKMT
jgi:hypothetical protein